MNDNEEIRELNPSQLEGVSGGTYSPGAYKEEAKAFFRNCVGEQTYDLVMSREAGRMHPYVAARVFLNQTDWEKYVWVEQHGSLDDFGK